LRHGIFAGKSEIGKTNEKLGRSGQTGYNMTQHIARATMIEIRTASQVLLVETTGLTFDFSALIGNRVWPAISLAFLMMLAPSLSAQEQLYPNIADIQGTPVPGTSIVAGGTVVPPQGSPIASQTGGDVQVANSKTVPKGDTWVQPPAELQSLIAQGSVPTSLDELRLLQRQTQLVASRAAECTVSVQIGPAQGCGVIISESGFVLTAAHVAMRPRKSAVLTLADGRTVTATTRGMNRFVDAGLMKIDDGQNGGKPWPCATPGTSKDLTSGMWCIATGHPGGYERERGMVTRVGRILDVRKNSLVTDCALIGGDSGGPLFDLSGRLIAVHSRIGNDVADNLHVPIDHYDECWDQMSRGDSWGFLRGFKPMFGVRGNGADQANVVEVYAGSPAKEAGIEPGDVIERFGDVQVAGFESLKTAVSDTMPGERVKVWVRREGRLIQVIVEIGRADED
jgi:S1-C subfamily serine protease